MIYSKLRNYSNRGAGCYIPPSRIRAHHPDFNSKESLGWKAVEAEGKLSEDGWRREQQWALDMGLPGADSITDKTIPTFARGELPHFAGINTYLFKNSQVDDSIPLEMLDQFRNNIVSANRYGKDVAPKSRQSAEMARIVRVLLQSF